MREKPIQYDEETTGMGQGCRGARDRASKQLVERMEAADQRAKLGVARMRLMQVVASGEVGDVRRYTGIQPGASSV